MSAGRMEVSRVTITEWISEDGGDVGITYSVEPDDIALIDALGMIAFAQAGIVADHMERETE